MTRPSHAALVEEVTREVCLSKGDDWDEAVRLGCQHEYEPAARAILSLIAARLSDVTPEMVEAAEYAWAQRIKDKAGRGFVGTVNPQESFKANWRAMLDASALNGGK